MKIKIELEIDTKADRDEIDELIEQLIWLKSQLKKEEQNGD